MDSRTCRNTPDRSTGVSIGRRGPKRQLDVEARYWELLAAGVGTVEACRAAGITHKTGIAGGPSAAAWRPLQLAEAARSNRYLSALERRRIVTVIAGAAASHPDLRLSLDDLDRVGLCRGAEEVGPCGVLRRSSRVSAPWTIVRKALQARHLQRCVRRQGLEPRTRWTGVTACRRVLG